MYYTLARAVQIFFDVVYYLILARIIMSWFLRTPKNPIYKFLGTVTEPILAPFRALSYKILGGKSMIDLSPIFAIMAMIALRTVILTILAMIFI